MIATHLTVLSGVTLVFCCNLEIEIELLPGVSALGELNQETEEIRRSAIRSFRIFGSFRRLGQRRDDDN